MSCKQKHMSYDDLYIIETDLNNNESFKQIVKHIQKNCTTVSKCIRNNYVVTRIGVIGSPFNSCKNRYRCKIVAICDYCYKRPGSSCRGCPDCFKHCPDYVEEIYSKLTKPPYVCNSAKQETNVL